MTISTRPASARLLPAVLLAAALVACGEPLPAAPEASVPAARLDRAPGAGGGIKLRAVNGVALEDAAGAPLLAADSLSLTAKVKVKKDDPAIQSVLLMRVRADSFPTALGGAPARVEPGEHAEVTVTTFRAPAGTHRYFLRGASLGGPAVLSDTVEVTVSYPSRDTVPAGVR